MNISAIQFDFDRPHIFVGDMATDEYMRRRVVVTGTLIGRI
jgi:hypothetical protein